MAKLLEVHEAAAKLGISADALLEMRQRGDIFAIRDGGNFKFKEEEVERVISERGGGMGNELDDLISPSLLDDDDSGDDMGSILVSEQELGVSGESASSTVIGKTADRSAAESDITLASESGISSSSDVQLVKPGSDLNLAGSDIGGSEISIGTGSDLQLDSEGGTGKAGSDISIGSGKLDFATDSALDLGDDDLVLGGSGIGSDVTLGGGDSGINLASPADSGLSLEDEPLDLMGSSVDASFELGEDDDVISLSNELADPDEATQLKADEEFLLSPAGDLGGDDSDSGSQVIALEDSEAFDENADTMLRPAQPALVVEDAGDDFVGMPAGVGTPMANMSPNYAPAGVPEAPYSVWNVLGLMSCAFFLMLTGMLMTDLMRNMWAFDTDQVMSTALMDSILSGLGMQ